MSFTIIPKELQLEIIRGISPWELAQCSLVNKEWYALTNDPSVWRNIARNHAIVTERSAEDIKQHVIKHLLFLDTDRKIIDFLECFLSRTAYGQNSKCTITFTKNNYLCHCPCTLTLIVKGTPSKSIIQSSKVQLRVRFNSFSEILKFERTLNTPSDYQLQIEHLKPLMMRKKTALQQKNSFSQDNTHSFRSARIGPFEIILAFPLEARPCYVLFSELTQLEAQIYDIACSKIRSFSKCLASKKKREWNIKNKLALWVAVIFLAIHLFGAYETVTRVKP